MFKVGASVKQIYLVYEKNSGLKNLEVKLLDNRVASLPSMLIKFSICKNYLIKLLNVLIKLKN